MFAEDSVQDGFNHMERERIKMSLLFLFFLIYLVGRCPKICSNRCYFKVSEKRDGETQLDY